MLFLVNVRELQVVDNIQYLDLGLARSLRWGKHLKKTKLKLEKFTYTIKILAGPGWGAHPKHLRRLYVVDSLE